MGARKKNAPRRGSLGLRPRKRAASIVPRIRSWPEVKSPKPLLLAFAAYKAGMTHAYIIYDKPDIEPHIKNLLPPSAEIFVPVTVLEAPPMIPLAIRAYKYDPNHGLLTFTEAWVNPEEIVERKDLNKEQLKSMISSLELHRVVPRLNLKGFNEKLRKIHNNIDKIADIRVIMATQPKLTGGLSKKKPDIIEIKIGGGSSIQERLEYAESILGKEITIRDVFREGQFVDVIAVTKGKGFQGVIKRFGVKELPRWHKHRKGSRKVGSRSPAMGAVSPVPQPGQTGYHHRTEYNKRILKIGDNGYEITPKGGFIGYGIVKSTYVLLHGSVPGPRKRIVILRHPIRKTPWEPTSPPTITYISLESKQGA